MKLIPIALAILGAANAFAQSVPSTASTEGLELLKRVAQRYVVAKSYHIEAVEERTHHGDLERSWYKTILTAAEAPGNRHHYEGHSSSGSASSIADGKTVWTYHIEEHRYTQKPATEEPSSESKVFTMPEFALRQAERLRTTLGDEAKHLKSATRLPDASLTMNGHEISCYVVRVQTADMKRVSDYSFEKTIWIDKTHENILRIVEHANTYMLSGTARIPEEMEKTTTYSVTELDGAVPDDLFTFAPPADAMLIQEFPDPRKHHSGPDLSGQPAPDLNLKSSDGKLVSLNSFRGQPVLLDVWATWCAPCVKGLGVLALIYAEAKDKHLVLLSVDQDEEAKTATDFLAKKGFAWPNFHDDDGEVSKTLGSSGIPRTILIDPQGKIVYDGNGAEDELRTAVTKLGPEYASLAPKPQAAPCSVAK